MILFFDSSAMTVHLRIVAAGVDQSCEWEAGRQLSKEMLAYLRDRLAHHDATFKDIEGIGVYKGPGSFTGLRIGLVVMNTLADSLSIPIVGVTGEDWQQEALERLKNNENDRIVLPEYGGEANITVPRK